MVFEVKRSKMVNLILLGVVVAISSSFTTNCDANVISRGGKLSSHKNIVSLKQFSILNTLGKGRHSTVFLAKKNGGSDDGNLYALKAINISYTLEREEIIRRKHNIAGLDLLNSERKILEAVKGTTWATELHYAFHEGDWTFLVIDVGIGGDLESRLEASMPNETTAQLILAEVVTLVEKLHKANILHGDLHPGNFVIDSNGHLLMTDFGRAEPLLSDDITNVDWNRIYYMCHQLFAKPKRNKNEIDLIRMLRTMTSAQLPDLKTLPYFHGIDWTKVALRVNPTPFEQNQRQINQNDPIDLVSLLNIRPYEELNVKVAKRLSNFAFAAAKHTT